jgi:hypothetical protein
MDFDNIFLLGNAFIRGALHVQSKQGISNDIALARGACRPAKPLVFQYHSGGRPRDLVGTSHATLDLLSARTVQLLREHDISGWTTFPVQVYAEDDLLLEGYEGLAVTGRCGPIENSKSREHWRPPARPGVVDKIRVWLGLYFDLATWDGSDIFGPASTAHVFVVERVKQAIERARLTNFSFQALSAVERLVL